MQLRFTLDNDLAGSQQIDNPDGWRDIKIKLERHPDFHSLVEGIEVPLIFYGRNNEVDGGYHYITDVIDNQGINTIVTIQIEIDENDDGTWEDFYTGNLDLSAAEKFSEGEQFFKLKCPITQTSLWSDFINRLNTPVDIKSYRDLDDNSIDPADSITVQLRGQTIKKTSEFDGTASEDFNSGGNTTSFTRFSHIGLDVNRTEIEETFTLGFGLVSSGLSNVIEAKEAGWVTISVDGLAEIVASGTDLDEFFVQALYKINAGTQLEIVSNGATLGGVPSASEQMSLVGTKSVYLNPGDLLYVYVSFQVTQTTSAPLSGSMGLVDFNLTMTQQSVVPDTTADAFFIHDVADAIVRRISPFTPVYSEILGGTLQGYDENGCNWRYVLLKGLHARGWSLADKPFFHTFKDFWDGANPIFNLGLGYEELESSPGYNVIRIEDKAHFYQEDISLTLSNVDNIKHSYDRSHIFKSIAIGYQKWSAESAGGIDDPQTKRVYSTIFKQIGAEVSQLSRFIAAGLAIEQTRRNRAELDKDWRLDEDTLIIAINENSSPLFYEPEFDENFTGITGINNPSSRYNLRITPAYNFLRWIQYFRGCLQKYTNTDFKFASGEGNYDFAGTMDSAEDCFLDADIALAESADIPVDISYRANDFLHLPDRLEFSYKLSWSDYKTIRNNRKKAIQVSSTESDYDICHINILEYSLFESMADFDVWIGGRTEGPVLYSVTIDDDFASQSFNYSFTQVAAFSGSISSGGAEEFSLAQLVQPTVTVNIGKTTNGGLASGSGWYKVRKNGILVSTFGFAVNDDISDIDFIITTIAGGDEISVEIREIDAGSSPGDPDPCDGCDPYGPVSPTQTQNCRNEGGIDYYDQLYHDGCCGTTWVTIQGACP